MEPYQNTAQHSPRGVPEVEAFMNDRLGLFVHFGAFSVLGGEWKGEMTPGVLSETIMCDMQIPLTEYRKVTRRFAPDASWAQTLADAAQELGCRYIVLTSKHADGFCLFASDVDDYNTGATIGRDLVAELAAVCRARGLKLGLYYNHTLSFSEENGGGWLRWPDRPAEIDNFWDFPDRSKKDFAKYLYGRVFPQVRELLTRYGELLLIWFDYPHNITPAQCEELYAHVKSFQPHCLVNSRIGPVSPDYYDLGDNMIPMAPMAVPQQALVTLNDCWGYNAYNHNWKTPDELIGMMTRCQSCGVNLLVNVGPMADGSLPRGTRHIIETVSEWTAQNRDALYDTRPSPLRTLPEWGYLARRGNELFLYRKDHYQKTVTLTGLRNRVLAVLAAADGRAVPFTQSQGEPPVLRIELPDVKYPMPVYRVICEGDILPQETLYQQENGLHLFPYWAKKLINGQKTEIFVENSVHDHENGTRGLTIGRAGGVAGWTDPAEALTWEVYFTRPGLFRIELVTQPGEHLGDGVPRRGAEIPAANAVGIRVTAEDAAGNRDTGGTPVLAEQSRFALSRTGSDNIRVVCPAGNIRVTAPGPAVITLHREGKGVKLPLAWLRLQ